MHKVLKTGIKILVALVISYVFLYFLLYTGLFNESLKVLKGIDMGWVLIVLALYLLTTFLKGLRWRSILDNKLGVLTSFFASSVHALFINLLPFRLGEASMLYILKNKGVKVRVSLSYLVVLRLLDVISMLCLFFIGVLFVGDNILGAGFMWVVGAALIVFIGIVYSIIFHSQMLVALAKKLFGVFRVDKKSFFKKCIVTSEQVSKEIDHLKKGALLTKLFIQSMLIWFLGIVSIWALLKAMHISFPFEKTLVAVVIQVIIANLPIQGMAGFGTYEGFWTLGFVVMGMTKAAAIISGLNAHIILLAMTILIGLIGLIFISKTKKFMY
ncbi:MAG: flippase-like domain-containing protein [Nanoarchaeota archaeon]|nr:flippase-like domain-containing protein [Nanoarchaeota archaeon]